MVLTEEERAVVAKQFQATPQDEYIYCPPCTKVLKDREQGAQLIKGLFQATLTMMTEGKGPEKAAKQLYRHLLQATEKKKP